MLSALQIPSPSANFYTKRYGTEFKRIEKEKQIATNGVGRLWFDGVRNQTSPADRTSTPPALLDPAKYTIDLDADAPRSSRFVQESVSGERLALTC